MLIEYDNPTKRYCPALINVPIKYSYEYPSN